MIGRRRLALAPCLTIAWSAFASVAATPPMSQPVDVIVRWEGDAGPEAFRVSLGEALAHRLLGACFRNVSIIDDPAAARADLRLVAVLDRYREETLFDDSIDKALAPDEPGSELRREARFEIRVRATLAAGAGGAVAAETKFHTAIAYRPVMIGEDPRETARERALERIAHEVVKSVCKGGPKAEARVRAALEEQPAR